MAKVMTLCKVHSFSTAPNLCQHTTVFSSLLPLVNLASYPKRGEK